MNDFTASNGVILGHSPEGHILLPKSVMGLGEDTQQALREFFQAEADERLGRWRDPEDPVFVVYSGVAWNGMYAPIRVVAETNGASWLLDREDHEPNVHESVLAVARRYFDAHPEPRPWHDAQPGEVWELTVDDEQPAAFYPSKSLDRHFTPVMPSTGMTAVPFDWPLITAGRRIWPEVSS